jgi:hypothetical protein
VLYHVRVVNAAGSQGDWSADSDGITIDNVLPDSSVTTGGLYGPGTWPPIGISGGASDPGSGVFRVDIRIFDDTLTSIGTARPGLHGNLVQPQRLAWSYAFPAASLTDATPT